MFNNSLILVKSFIAINNVNFLLTVSEYYKESVQYLKYQISYTLKW